MWVYYLFSESMIIHSDALPTHLGECCNLYLLIIMGVVAAAVAAAVAVVTTSATKVESAHVHN